MTRPAILVFVLALAPALAAVWTHPGFVTQDGPAHLYNAQILAHAFDPASPFRDAFNVHWDPLPNWAGHLVLMGLVSSLPPRVADRAMTSITLVAFAGSLVWLRSRVAGGRGMPVACVYAALLALNVTWLLGFGSFLLGAALFPITLGVWWSGREIGFVSRRALGLAALTTLGYFCHLISLGLTALGLVVLELATPGPRRLGRALATALGLAPLVPLGVLYLRLSRRGGGLAPEWKHLVNPLSPASWLRQLAWVDPVTFARKDCLPFVYDKYSPFFGVLSPVSWFVLGLTLALLAASLPRSEPDSRRRHLGWWLLAAILLAGGVAGPDTLGANHGEYLQQRVVLLGLAALMPVLSFDAARPLGRASAVAFTLALGFQTAFVWEYAATSERTAGAFVRAIPDVGRRQRVAALLLGIRTRFRANPLLHADCTLGVGNGNIVWGDYESRFYYFPVRFRPGLNAPDPADLEWITLHDAPDQAPTRARLWADLLDRHAQAIDVLVVWGSDPAIDALNAPHFRETYTDGPLRILKRRLPDTPLAPPINPGHDGTTGNDRDPRSRRGTSP